MSESTLPAAVAGVSLSETGTAANTGTQINAAGMAFGQLIHHVGEAVADTQRQLNETTAQTALALAEATIDVIAARQRTYHDDGTLDAETNLVMKMPLASYVDVVSHEVSQVHIQGVFQATGFQSSSSSTTETTLGSSYAQLHIGAPLAGPSTSSALAQGATAVASGATGGFRSGYETTTTTSVAAGSASESSYGQMRMNAEIRPRADVGVPRPSQVVRGPLLSLTPVAQPDGWEVEKTGETVTARRAAIMIHYRKRGEDGEGAPIVGRSFAIEAPGLYWTVCDATGVAATESTIEALRQTDADGRMYLLVRRDLSADADRAPRPFAVTARIGMVNTTVVVSL